jgi:exopolyphosphatase/guanosine-5'-triphosphate,3'-diphosphate pyrophosphatase
MRFAAIDVGSNAMRLRIVEAHANHPTREQLSLLPDVAPGYKEVHSSRAAVRLGHEVFVTGKLAAASIGQACSALREFRQAMDHAHVEAYRAAATSALREASNRTTLIERARRESRIELEVIEGVEEARLIQLAVVRRLRLSDKTALLIDVGGGSTELTLLERGTSVWSISLPIGTVRLLEIYLRSAKTVDRPRQRLLAETIDRALSEATPSLKHIKFDLVVGTGGSMDSLSELCPAKGGHGGHARAADMHETKALLHKLFSMTSDERASTFALRPDRADTIVTAASIFVRIAECFRIDAIVAPGVGLKEGILDELIDKRFDRWDAASAARTVTDACLRLGQRYGFDKAHGELVARHALSLFDDLSELHGLGNHERLLLHAASILHDVGDYVSYSGHHKHSQYIIEHSDVMGLSPTDRAIVANVARYHRKSPPDLTHPAFRELDKDHRTTVRYLAAILRLADALDREHLGKVDGVRAELDSKHRRLVLHLTGEDDRELEEWTLRAKSELFRDVFDTDVQVAAAVTSIRPPPDSSNRSALDI